MKKLLCFICGKLYSPAQTLAVKLNVTVQTNEAAGENHLTVSERQPRGFEHRCRTAGTICSPGLKCAFDNQTAKRRDPHSAPYTSGRAGGSAPLKKE